MAYGLKYYATAYGLSSVQWKIELLEKDYASASSEIRMFEDGIKIGYDREDDRFNTIYSRYAILDLKIQEGFNLDALQYDDERKFQVKIYQNNVLEFIGWLIPFYSSEPFEDASISSITIMAKDGINQLKDKYFIDENPDILSKKQSFKNLICQSLRALGYNTDIEIYYNKYENGMNKTSSDCPLTQNYCNIDSFKKDDGTYINYYDVLYRLLYTHDLRIEQSQGSWVVVSSIEQYDGAVSGRKFNYLGIYQSNVTLSSDIIIHTGGLKIKSNSNIRKGIPIQQYTSEFFFEKDKNLVLNGELVDFLDYEPNKWHLNEDWVLSNGEVSENIGGGIVFENTYATRPSQIDPNTPIADASLISNKYLESDEITIDDLESFTLQAEIYSDGDIDAVRIRVELYNEGHTNQHYVDENGKLTLVPSSIYAYNYETDSYKFIDINWKTIGAYLLPMTFKYMKIRLYEGIRLRLGTPTNTKVKFKNIKVTAKPRDFKKEFLGKKYEVKNTNLSSSKKEDSIRFFYKDAVFLEPQSVFRLYLNSDANEATSITSGKWKRTAESTEREIVKSVLIDRLSVTTRFCDIFEGSVFGFIDIKKTPYLTDGAKRFLVLFVEYNLNENTSEVLLSELYVDSFNVNIKEFNVFEDDKVVEVFDDSVSTILNLGEKYDYTPSPNTTIINQGIDAVPVDSTLNAPNKGHLGLGEEYAESITIGSSKTLTEIKGQLDLYGNIFFDNSMLAEVNPEQEFSLGLNTQLFYTDGKIRAARGIEAFAGLINLTAERLDPEDEESEPQAFIIADATPLYLKTSKVNVMGDLASNVIGAYSGNSVTGTDNWTFNNAVTVANPSLLGHAVNLFTLNNALAAFSTGGIMPYGSVKAASNSHVIPSGIRTLDTYTTELEDRILLHHQSDPANNWVYIVKSGAWERDTNFANFGSVFVEYGYNNISSVFYLAVDGTFIEGTTAAEFKLYFKVTGSNNFALKATGTTSTAQVLTGWHAYNDKITVPTPQSDAEATTKLYVDAKNHDQDVVISSLSSTISAIPTNYWSKLAGTGYTYGIGHTANNDLEIITNNLKRATFSKSGGLDLIGYFIGQGGADIHGQLLTGHHGGTSASSYNVDIVRGGSTSRAALRFANYIAGAGAGATNQVKRGIEFDADNNVTIGTYDSNFTNFEKTFNSEKSIIFDINGKTGFGVTPTERVQVDGNIRWSGVLKPSGNAPTADAQFLVSDSTTGNKYINFGEFGQFQTHEQYANIFDAPFGASFIAGTITNLPDAATHGHLIKMAIGTEYPDEAVFMSFKRPFLGAFDNKIYIRGYHGDEDSGWLAVGGDSMQNFEEELGEATIKTRGYFYEIEEGDQHGFFGINQLEGGFEMNLRVSNLENENIAFYGTKMSAEDGRLYFREGDNAPRKYALIDEVGTGGSGTSYTLDSPLYFNPTIPNQINIHEATSSADGYLTAAKFNEFSAKLSDGGTISSGITVRTNSNVPSSRSSIKFTHQTQTQLGGEIYMSYGYIPNGLNLVSNHDTNINIIAGILDSDSAFNPSKNISLYGDTVTIGGATNIIGNMQLDTSNIAALVGGNAKLEITSLGSGIYKAKLVAA